MWMSWKKGNISKLSIININFDYYESETEANGQSQWIISRSKATANERNEFTQITAGPSYFKRGNRH